jgi:6,7-dimethyl-8-ribityllumazine synthase
MRQPEIRIALVVGDFNADITHPMVERAKEHAASLGVQVHHIVRVPGAFDIPLVVKKLLERNDVDAVAALGAVLEGETEHDEIIAHQSARKLVDLALEYEKPVTLGISGPGETYMQAQQRIEGYACRAVESAVKLIRRMRELEDTPDS